MIATSRFQRNLILSLLGMLLALPAWGAEPVFQTPQPGMELPPLSLKVPGSDTPFTLDSLKGKVVLVDFWATWCAPCVHEMPALDVLQERYGAQGFVVVPASVDSTGFLTIKTFYRQQKLEHLSVYWDEKMKTFDSWHLKGLPSAFLYGRDGKMIGMVQGEYDWYSEGIIKTIEQALAVKP